MDACMFGSNYMSLAYFVWKYFEWAYFGCGKHNTLAGQNAWQSKNTKAWAAQNS